MKWLVKSGWWLGVRHPRVGEGLLAISCLMLLAACSDFGERDNPLDPGADNYVAVVDDPESSSSVIQSDDSREESSSSVSSSSKEKVSSSSSKTPEPGEESSSSNASSSSEKQSSSSKDVEPDEKSSSSERVESSSDEASVTSSETPKQSSSSEVSSPPSSSSKDEPKSSSSSKANPPAFTNRTPSFDIAENVAIGTAVGSVSVSNATGGETFSIEDVSGKFAVGTTTGAIMVKGALDFEMKSNYSVMVLVSNSDGGDMANVSISVTDVNETPNIETASFTVSENSAAGTFVGQVVASDPDVMNPAFGTLYYTLVDFTPGAASLFKIDVSGRITVAQGANLDYETTNLYYVKAIATDGSLSDTAMVTVAVSDVDEPASSSSSVATWICGDSTVTRGDHEYATVVINEQCWTKENLRYEPSSGTTMCYGGAAANCETYGRLYDYEAANLACPTGWRLPTKAEYEALADYSGADMYDAGAHFKANSGWTGENGDDLLEFTALPGGKCNEEQECSKMGTSGYWWTSTEKVKNSSHFALYLNGDNSAFTAQNIMENDQYISVRCVKK